MKTLSLGRVAHSADDFFRALSAVFSSVMAGASALSLDLGIFTTDN